jgi:PAS domain S-box-containing protein/putative nucleotidyltransferase with HDIG domain
MTDPLRTNQELLDEISILIQRIKELEKSESDRKPDSESIQVSEERYRLLANNILDIIYSLDGEGKIVTVNSAALERYGYSEQGAKGKPFLDFIHPEDREIVIGSFLKAIEEQRKVTTGLQFRIVAENGFSYWFELNSRARFDSHARYIGEDGMLRDITDRKQIEEKIQNSETFLNRLIEQSPMAMWISDDQGNLMRLNQSCCDLLNITADEVVGRYNIFQDNIVKEQGFLPLVKAVFERGETVHFEIDYNSSHIEGLKLQRTVAVILDTTIFPIKDTHGRITHAVIQHKNITARKLAEEALRLKNLVFDVSITANSIADLDGIITEVNDTFLRVWAYPCKDKVIGKPIMHFFNDPKEAAAILTALNNIGLWEGNYTAKKKDGSTFIGHGLATVIRNENGKVIGYQSAVMDITERMRAEEALKESREMLRLISENMSDMIRVTDLQGNNVYASPSHFKSLGYKPEERVGKTGFDIMHPDDVEMVINKFTEGVAGQQEHIRAEYRVRHADGHYLWLETRGDILRDAQGKAANVIMSSRDISERKQNEALLHEREELFRSFFENAVETMFLTAPNGRIMAANPAACEMFGWTEQEFIEGGRNILVDVTDPRLGILLKERLEKGNAHGVLTYLRRDGTKFQGEVTSAIYKDKDGYQKSSIIIRDITERLRTEDALKRSEKKYRLLHESMMDGFVSVGMDGKFLECNEIYRNMLGYSETELALSTYVELTPEKWHAYEADIVQNQILKRGYSDVYEKEYRRKDGTIFPVELHTVLVHDEQGNPAIMWGIARDITARKRRVEEIQELSLTNQRILNSVGEGIYGLDLNSNVTFINAAGAKMLGWEVKELIGKNSHSLWHHTKADGTNYPEEECGLKEVLKSGVSKTFIEDWFWKKDGNSFPVEYTNNPIYEKESLIGAVVTFRDITERKQATEKLKKALGATVQAIAMVVETRDPYTAGHQRRVADLAEAIATDMGLAPDQIDGLRMAGIIHDIGKISIPAEILTKPTRLSDLEFRLIQTHAQSGYDILRDIEFPWPIARIVLEHHERIDGSGYPHGATGENVLLESKILAVADAVEAIASDRPYRPARGMDIALEEIRKNRGKTYDNVVADVCLRLFQEKGFQLEKIYD